MKSNTGMDNNASNLFESSFYRLKTYCENESFLGWDPYDGLNSPIFQNSPLKFYKAARLIWIQLFKKNPYNLRPLFSIKKGHNPKGLGLFLAAYCNLYKVQPHPECLATIKFLSNKLLELKTDGYSGDCWGYNFDWQSRLEFMPNKTPTVVATSFVGYSMFDAYDITQDERYLDSALSCCDFIAQDLNRTQKSRGFIFSYSPLDRMRVYNASLLGSRLLSRAYSYCNKRHLLDLARESVTACAAAQNANGSWLFGEDKSQKFIDSFHTGYKIESIFEYQKYSGDTSFNENITKGTKFYLSNFFLEDGTPKYYHNRTFPIDIHCPAQFVVTLSRLNIFLENRQLIEKVLCWTVRHMQDAKQGYFYYQLKKLKSSKIPYIRWGQAWMLYGLSFYLLEMDRYEKIHCGKN
jgi:hypothetical protein